MHPSVICNIINVLSKYTKGESGAMSEW